MVKEDWQYGLSSRVLQAVKDLSKSWKLFFNNQDTAGRPAFKQRSHQNKDLKQIELVLKVVNAITR